MELGPFWLTDQPVNDIEITIESDDDLTSFTLGTAALYDADGTLSAGFAEVAFTDNTLTFAWPDEPFEAAGIHTLVPTITTPGGGSLRLESVQLVVQEDTGWHTLESANAGWDGGNGPDQNVILYEVLEIARLQCETFAPALAADATVPLNYRKAQLLQARNIWNASKVNPSSGGLGEDGFVIRPFPMDWHVKNLLRPKRGRPLVG